MHTRGEGILFGSFVSMIDSIEGAFIGTALVYWIMILAEILLKKPAMGEGDVKLMGAIGAFCGWQGAVFALFGGAILGCVAIFSLSSARLLLGKGFNLKSEEAPAEARAVTDAPVPADGAKPAETDEDDGVPAGAIPFGPSLAGGAVVYLLFAQPYVAAYFNQLSFLFK
jgi:leader peptidase (prepilin peptidase)/N-methyltransferase